MLDKNGFKRPTYLDLLEDTQNKARELFGENVNVSPRSPLGIILILFAFFLSKVYELMELVYNNSFPGTATGVSLQKLGKLKGMSLLTEDYASGQIQINGPPNAFVAPGLIVGTTDDIYFDTVEDVRLDGTGVGTADIYAQVAGLPGNVDAGAITVLLNPTADGLTVANAAPTTGGRNTETDAEFYQRFQETPSKSGSPSVESIQAKLAVTPGVRDAIVNHNPTRMERNGLPPNCIAPFVFGGDDDVVAKAIFAVAAGGIQIYGTTVKNVTDSKGTLHEVGFTRPDVIQVYVKVTLTKGASFPFDGVGKVHAIVLNYIGGTSADGTTYGGLGLDDNVIHARLIAAILNSQGVDDVNVELSVNNSTFAEENINILAHQVAKTTHDKVVIV
ncbi:hypothetical protein AWH48_11605 [Domibacillus aminovorans]|uniref:Baseplate protein J-like barrel domain-containing protein n=1 Tax=Domibacillus aminovorans TaxID=29332 RepID=A0A177KLB9_9BACI|nr:baseplate J/gp47 family protein [Domibacillus aminovorans]OAH53907.1 hypothetical protein AWH48_11605 [Domibacillus aminovorans]